MNRPPPAGNLSVEHFRMNPKVSRYRPEQEFNRMTSDLQFHVNVEADAILFDQRVLERLYDWI
jgi:hypothetical protein